MLNVHKFAMEYEFRGDGGDYTPTDAERVMLEDFGTSLLTALTATEQAEPSPDARSGAVRAEAAREALRELALVKMKLPLKDWGRISNTILAALEPADPATHAEREFNDVLDGAQAFNDALPERMRKNARDWLRPDDETAMDAEPVAYLICDEAGDPFGATIHRDYAAWKTSGGLVSVRPLFTHPPESRLREALEEISCLQAGRSGHGVWRAVKIARAALAQEDGRDDKEARE